MCVCMCIESAPVEYLARMRDRMKRRKKNNKIKKKLLDSGDSNDGMPL